MEAGVTRPPLAGRAVVHAQVKAPWPRGRACCDRLGDRMRVPATGPDGRVLIRAALNLVEAPDREVTCRRCLRILASHDTAGRAR